MTRIFLAFTGVVVTVPVVTLGAANWQTCFIAGLGLAFSFAALVVE
jgi:hypothetical protein